MVTKGYYTTTRKLIAYYSVLIDTFYLPISNEPHLPYMHPVAHFQHPLVCENAIAPQTRGTGTRWVQPPPKLHNNLIRDRVITNTSARVDIWQL